jgi:1-acyl-sn-glycerol-3-phosphate acyltransferase
MIVTFYNCVRNVVAFFARILFVIEVKGLENIPKEGPIILASNHKSNLDPVFIAVAIKTRDISAISKKELFSFKPFGYFLKKLNVIPINRDNPDISTLKTVIKQLREGKAIGIFPEGRRYIGSDEFGKAKSGLAMFAVKGKAPIAPISIISNYKLFNKVIVYIDKPISFEEYYKEKLVNEDYDRLSNEIMSIIKKNIFKNRF